MNSFTEATLEGVNVDAIDLFDPTINRNLKFKRLLIRNKKIDGAMISGSKMDLR